MIARVIRNLAVGELVVAGDLGDRGPRIDKVIDVIAQQPNVAITWGNHDANWMAACLGQPAAIATVVRLSLRYQRLAQLEDGYGISLEPVARLAREAYGDDPAERFQVKGDGRRATAWRWRGCRRRSRSCSSSSRASCSRAGPSGSWRTARCSRRIDPAAGTVDDRRQALPAARHPVPDGRLGAIRASCRTARRAASPSSPQAFVDQPHAVDADVVRGVARPDVAAPRPVRDLPRLRAGRRPPASRWRSSSTASRGAARRCSTRSRSWSSARFARAPPRSPSSIAISCSTCGPGRCRRASARTGWRRSRPTSSPTPRPTRRPRTRTSSCSPTPAFCARILARVRGRSGAPASSSTATCRSSSRPARRRSRSRAARSRSTARSPPRTATRASRWCSTPSGSTSRSTTTSRAPEAAVSQHADIVPTVSDVVVHDRPRTVGDTETGDEIRAEIAVLEELVRAFEANIIRERP